MKRWIVPLLVAALLVVLAVTAQQWLPPLLEFAGTNSDLIQGLADLIQILLWIGAGVTALVGFVTGRRGKETPRERIQAQDSTVATHGGVAGSIAVGGGVGRDVVYVEELGVYVADPALLWQAIRDSQRPPTEDLRQAIERYLTCVVDRHRYLEFKGMGVSDRVALRLPLLEMYVPLKARVEMPEGETWARELHLAGRRIPDEELGERMSEPQPVLELLRRNSGLIVLGDPGSGKTTFLKHLALKLATGRGEELGLDEARLPVLIPLSAYANALAERDVRLDGFVACYFHDLGADLPIGAMVEEALREGGALVLLDGLDEVAEACRGRVRQAVQAFLQTYPNVRRVIVASRIRSYVGDAALPGFAEHTLAPFDDGQIEQFVEAWYRAQIPLGRMNEAQAEDNARDLQSAALSADLRELASNPMLLTTMAIIHQREVGLPRERVRLYSLAVQNLLGRWQMRKGIAVSTALEEVLRDDLKLRAIMERLAYEVHLQQAQQQGAADLLRKDLLVLLEDPAYLGETGLAGEFLDYVDQRAGLLVGQAATRGSRPPRTGCAQPDLQQGLP